LKKDDDIHWYARSWDPPEPQDDWRKTAANIWVYQVPMKGADCPLYQYTFNGDPKRVQFLTSDPAAESLYDFTQDPDPIGYVYNPQWKA
jgi:hypothetical protein